MTDRERVIAVGSTDQEAECWELSARPAGKFSPAPEAPRDGCPRGGARHPRYPEQAARPAGVPAVPPASQTIRGLELRSQLSVDVEHRQARVVGAERARRQRSQPRQNPTRQTTSVNIRRSDRKECVHRPCHSRTQAGGKPDGAGRATADQVSRPAAVPAEEERSPMSATATDDSFLVRVWATVLSVGTTTTVPRRNSKSDNSVIGHHDIANCAFVA